MTAVVAGSALDCLSPSVDSYQRLLEQSRLENFTDLSALRFIYQSGFTRNNETVVVYVARSVPSSQALARKVSSFQQHCYGAVAKGQLTPFIIA